MQLSKNESSVYDGLRKNKIFVFRVLDICRLLKISTSKAYNLIKSLKNKKIIKTVGKRFFTFNDIDDFFIATRIHFPSYISFLTALNYYGFSDHISKKILLATTKYTYDIGNFRYVTLSRKRFFGYKNIDEIVIAEKEKAIVDSLLFPKYSIGMREVVKSVEGALREINIEKLIDYAFRVNSKVVLRRLGYILDNLNFDDKYLSKLRKGIGKGYELFDPSLPKSNNLNKKWLLRIN